MIRQTGNQSTRLDQVKIAPPSAFVYLFHCFNPTTHFIQPCVFVSQLSFSTFIHDLLSFSIFLNLLFVWELLCSLCISSFLTWFAWFFLPILSLAASRARSLVHPQRLHASQQSRKTDNTLKIPKTQRSTLFLPKKLLFFDLSLAVVGAEPSFPFSRFRSFAQAHARSTSHSQNFHPSTRSHRASNTLKIPSLRR